MAEANMEAKDISSDFRYITVALVGSTTLLTVMESWEWQCQENLVSMLKMTVLTN